jgi:hypothetical protein
MVGRESMPLTRSFEKGEVRVLGSGGTAARHKPSEILLGDRGGGDKGAGTESVVCGDIFPTHLQYVLHTCAPRQLPVAGALVALGTMLNLLCG